MAVHMLRQLLPLGWPPPAREPGSPESAWSCRSRIRRLPPSAAPWGMSTSRGFTVWICAGGQMDAPPWQTASSAASACRPGVPAFPARERADSGGGIVRQRSGRSLRRSPGRPSRPASGPHLDEPVRLGEDLGIMIHQQRPNCHRPPDPRMTRVSPAILAGCRPMEGSSST